MSDSVKLHVYRGPNDGSARCDFRGDNAIGHNEGDEHRTVSEIKNASEELIAAVLEFGPKANALNGMLKAAEPAFFGPIASTLGLGGDGNPGLRIGVWTPGHDEPGA